VLAGTPPQIHGELESHIPSAKDAAMFWGVRSPWAAFALCIDSAARQMQMAVVTRQAGWEGRRACESSRERGAAVSSPR